MAKYSSAVGKEVMQYSKEKLGDELKRVEKQVKSLDKLVEKRKTFESLQNASKNMISNDEMKKYVSENLINEISMIDKRLKKHDELKKHQAYLVTLNNQIQTK